MNKQTFAEYQAMVDRHRKSMGADSNITQENVEFLDGITHELARRKIPAILLAIPQPPDHQPYYAIQYNTAAALIGEHVQQDGTLTDYGQATLLAWYSALWSILLGTMVVPAVEKSGRPVNKQSIYDWIGSIVAYRSEYMDGFTEEQIPKGYKQASEEMQEFLEKQNKPTQNDE